MAVFTSEEAVRLKFQLNDTTLVPSELVIQSIDDAHTELLRYLADEYAAAEPEDALVIGETLLAGAHVYRSLASGDAFKQRHVAIGGNRVREGERFESLTAIANLTEDLAWYTLEPYLEAESGRDVAGVTDSTPVLGEEE